MDLTEFRPDLLFIGMSLPFTLRDAAGNILLAKGHRIETAHQLDGIQNRSKIYVEIDETDEGVRAMMVGINQLNRIGAPIKDFYKYLSIRDPSKADDKEVGTLIERWDDLESKLGGLLASAKTTEEFQEKLYALDQAIVHLLDEDATGSQLLLFHRSVSQYGGYSVLHALLCAALVNPLALSFSLNNNERRSLVCATLTMNMAMTHLQDLLALQKTPPSPVQRSEIDDHPIAACRMMLQAGVKDRNWLQVVKDHHAPLTGPESFGDWPTVQRMTKILQTVDRYTAAMSPRKSRTGRTARDSVRAVVLAPGETKHDEVGTALVRLLGLSPPGTYVTLANGETAVVVRRGTKPGEPWVASVLNKSGELIAEPRLRDTSRDGFSIQATLVAASVRINLNLEVMLKLIPRGLAM